MNSQAKPPASLLVDDVLGFLRRLAPLELAESWDNVGHLWGDASRPVERVMTCLTLSPDVAEEAIRERADLIVAHHPILFRPVQRLTHETPAGQMLFALARHDVAVYSAHTAYDNAVEGINRQLADRLELEAVVPLRAATRGADHALPDAHPGIGRMGRLSHPHTLAEFVARVKEQLGVGELLVVGPLESRIERVAIACGAGGEFIDDAIRQSCQVLVTGEARFHACLDARERGLALVLLGHFLSEQPAMRTLAEQIRRRFPALAVWASTAERDPLAWA
jgi:dinuclear metal center YbgI/SA1388 family protein